MEYVVGLARDERLQSLIEEALEEAAQRQQQTGRPARGAENCIKEQLSLFADRMSMETLRANQLRLYLSSLAYVLMVGLRRLGLEGTRWAQTETIRRGLLKIGAHVKVSVRRVYLSLAAGYPDEEAFAAVYRARCVRRDEQLFENTERARKQRCWGALPGPWGQVGLPSATIRKTDVGGL